MAASDITPGGAAPATGDGDIGQDLARLREDFMRLSETVTGLLGSGGGVATPMKDAAASARDAFEEATGSIARAGSGIVDDTGTRLRTLGHELDDTFQRSPMMGIAAAAGLGMIVGMLMRD
jgi:ElaB/YqjD/DUF883 family membrane-anchored ribosome-binding protein